MENSQKDGMTQRHYKRRHRIHKRLKSWMTIIDLNQVQRCAENRIGSTRKHRLGTTEIREKTVTVMTPLDLHCQDKKEDQEAEWDLVFQICKTWSSREVCQTPIFHGQADTFCRNGYRRWSCQKRRYKIRT